MKFRYENGVPTVESAIEQALASNDSTGIGSSATLLAELQRILTGELNALLDDRGIAKEWNDAIRTAVACVNGEL